MYAMISSGMISALVIGYQLIYQNYEDLALTFGAAGIFLLTSFFVGKWVGRMIDNDYLFWLIGYASTLISSTSVIFGFIIYSLFLEANGFGAEEIFGVALIAFFYMLILGFIPMILIGSLYGYLVRKKIREAQLNETESDS